MPDIYFYSRFPRWLLTCGIAVFATGFLSSAWNSYHRGLGLLASLTMLGAAFMVWLFFFAYRNRSARPVVAVSDEAVEFSSIFEAGFARKRIAIRDIASVGEPRFHVVDIATRSGERARVGLMELRSSEKGAVRDAIRERIAQVRGTDAAKAR